MNKQIILENQRGLHIRNGHIVSELGPGAYYSFGYNSKYLVYSIAAQAYLVNVNVNTSDMASIFVVVPVNIYIRDVRKYFLSGVSMFEAVNRALSKQLQENIGNQSLSEILENKLEVSADAINKAVSEFGLEVFIDGAAQVRLPRNLQNAIDAQEVARQRAKAELEEARGRTAVLRHYANAAKMTKDNPELLRLMLGQKAKSINVAFDAN